MNAIGMLIMALAVTVAWGQTAVDKAPTFEVASIRPSGPRSIRGSEGGPGTSDPERYRFTAATILDLIMIGYEAEEFQVSSSLPLDRRSFDLAVKVPAGTTKQQFRLMVQNLLAERFHLKLHESVREFPAYELGIAKSGPKLHGSNTVINSSQQPSQPQTPGEGWPELPLDRPGMVMRNAIIGKSIVVRVRAHQEPISALVRLLRKPDDLPIVDVTGLKGTYDFTLEYGNDLPNQGIDGSDVPSGAPTLFAALERQLGLQLVRRKLPFRVLIIDAIDKVPTEN